MGRSSSTRPTASSPSTTAYSFGKDAINALLKYLEGFSDRPVVIVAGYPVEMRRVMAANPGLASRFHVTLTVTSYTPEEARRRRWWVQAGVRRSSFSSDSLARS